MTKRLGMGTTHLCNACGYEVLLGHGHHSDRAVCTKCGADFIIDYPGGMFAACTSETPGTLQWLDSDGLRADERDNPVVLRSDVMPIGTDLPNLEADCCPRCATSGSLVLSLPDEQGCPKCHNGMLRKVGTWIQ